MKPFILTAATAAVVFLTGKVIMKQQATTTKPTPRPILPNNDKLAPRGIRNNNPLNIEYSSRNNWRGQVGTDGRFAIYEDDKWGFRAATRILRSYRKRGVNTIQSIIHTFAPAHENNSDHYANVVSQITGIDKYAKVDARNDVTAAKLLQAMAKMEVGHLYPMHEVMEGVKLA
ncbi:virion protein [Photobacterium swingsii]|uniref:virion protein n=1 Tax=Photobacterium swingsii TaxID=680026 RepID=UPI00406807D9